MTCNRDSPQYKRGKILYFDESDLAKWVMWNEILSQDEIEKQADEYIRTNPRRQAFLPIIVIRRQPRFFLWFIGLKKMGAISV